MKTDRNLKAMPAMCRVGLLASLICFSACSSNSDSNSGMSAVSSSSDASSSVANTGYEAVINDFIGYPDWPVVDYAVGASNPFIGDAHGGGIDSISRKTFMNGIAANSSGDFAQGSIIVKEVFTYQMGMNGLEKAPLEAGGLVAMVKRGGDFNPDNNGWEWFILEPDLSSVADQGAELLGGACNVCHSKAATQAGGGDYVFPKPTELVVAADAFADYTSWDLIEYDTDPTNLNGGAHINDADLRRVFQKQVLANPTEAGDMGYPIGTMLVKDISANDEVQQIVAMVKRGGSFDPDNGNWEYFVVDPSDPTQLAIDSNGAEMRGAIPLCIGCHVGAVNEAGTDFVFKHAEAPFNTDTAGEYVAHKAHLDNYAHWPLIDYALGASNPFLGMAHSNNNLEFARAVFQNSSAAMFTGDQYPTGSILIKETFTTAEGDKRYADQGGLLAMVKRGGTFNPDHNGWEWIMLSAEGDMIARAGDLMGGACNACHAAATGDAGTDYSFNKPSEKIASLEDFTDYASWVQIDETTGDSAANGGAHATNAIRKTYKKSATASPYFEAGEYPVGTIIVKELITDGEISQLYGMVKRGGNYNPAHGDWQWFLINTDLSGVTDLGQGAGCTGCHSKAGSEAETDPSFMGKDYVFYHQNDPVPLPVNGM